VTPLRKKFWLGAVMAILGAAPIVVILTAGWTFAAADRNLASRQSKDYQTRFDSVQETEAECEKDRDSLKDNFALATSRLDDSYTALKICLDSFSNYVCPACPISQPAVACPTISRMPDAMCVRMENSWEQIRFTSRVSFHMPGGSWLATPEWTSEGFKFDAPMGMNLEDGDRNFLRNGGGKTTYPDMVLRTSTQGNLSYRFAGGDGNVDILVCAELDWGRIREPGVLPAEGEEGP
jgi:hypothetical protein